jgi:cyanophycinase-like exopeptidase
MSLIALLGSGEYLPVMQPIDAHLLKAARKDQARPRVACLPTAAGREGQPSWRKWMVMGERHFRDLNAEVTALPVIDRASANATRWATEITRADLIYFSGGDPHYLYKTLRDTAVWHAIGAARERGAALAGCSAGAMILGHELPNFRAAGLTQTRAFGLLPVRLIFPHFDRWRDWRGPALSVLRAQLNARDVVLGIDEDTALVGRAHEPWTVMGRQTVTLITKHATRTYQSGETLFLNGSIANL